MPRPPRRIEAGLVYHVLNRGNRRSMIFRTDADFAAFVGVLTEALARFDGVDLLCWCIMGNHWHLVLRPRRDGQLQRFMQWLTLTHARRHHGFHAGAAGHLYQGRYKHFAVQDDEHFLVLCRYVEANPLRARLVRRAEDWRWSSLGQRGERAAAGDFPKWPRLSEWPVDRPRDWTRMVNAAIPEAELAQVRLSVNRERPLGSPRWTRRTATRLGLAQTLRPPGRPRKPEQSLSPRQRRRRAKEVAAFRS
jgi:putative transposase